jgi:glycosyltransferase involved in cell wall biosynthesis
VVHFHHYAVLGLEALLHVREALPRARIVLTLHEFQAICNHYGQMVKRGSQDLCRAASPRDCNRCFPGTPRADFFLRESYIRRFLALADAFVSPSHFLAGRYAAWGLPEDRIEVIENIPAPAPKPLPPPNGSRLRVGFFGQISSLKGIGVLLDAAALLEADGNTAVQIDIHGDASNQPEEFRAHISERIKTAGRNVRFHGAYDNAEVDRLMQGVDAVAVPSIWWENSPVVIQEALRNRRPVICSAIGGMAEKVRDGKDGFHVSPGSPAALADLLADLAADRGRLAAVQKTMAPSADPAKIVAAHLALYARLGAA